MYLVQPQSLPEGRCRLDVIEHDSSGGCSSRATDHRPWPMMFHCRLRAVAAATHGNTSAGDRRGLGLRETASPAKGFGDFHVVPF